MNLTLKTVLFPSGKNCMKGFLIKGRKEGSFKKSLYE